MLDEYAVQLVAKSPILRGLSIKISVSRRDRNIAKYFRDYPCESCES
jgi:hypothetical protein